jgi:hypothetical protein
MSLCRTSRLLPFCFAMVAFVMASPDVHSQGAKDKKDVDSPGKEFRQIDVVSDPSGKFLHQTELTAKDAPLPFLVGDPFGGKVGVNAVRYVLPVKKDKTYTITMTGPVVSPHLVLTDLKDGRIVNRTSYSGKSELFYRAPSDGKIYIYACNEARRLGKYELLVRGPATSEAAAPALPPSPPPGGTVTHKASQGIGDNLAGVVWNADAKSFFIVGLNGKIAEYSIPAVVKTQSADLKAQLTTAAMSSEGLVVTLFNGGLWILDPKDLSTVRRKMKTPGVMAIAASPSSKYAVVNTSQGDLSVCVIDLEKGTIVTKQQNRSPLRLAMSSDGKRVYSCPDGRLTVSALGDDGSLAEIDASEPIVDQLQNLCISPAGDFACAPCNNGNRNAPEHPKIGEFTTYVYGGHSLAKPLFAVASGPYPRAVGIDPKSGYIVAHDSNHQIKLYNFKGELLAEQLILPKGNNPTQFLPSPLGYDMLVVFSRHVVYVRLPEADKK